jgi:hypothetical protein
MEQVQITTCKCQPVSVLLVKNGVFPTSPTKPRTGVSLDLLEIYRALFERSCDAITALAAALHTIYERRGFRVYSSKVCMFQSLLTAHLIFNCSIESWHACKKSVSRGPRKCCHMVQPPQRPTTRTASCYTCCCRSSTLPHKPRASFRGPSSGGGRCVGGTGGERRVGGSRCVGGIGGDSG